MLLTNSYYSSLHTYINSINDLFNGKEINCDFKCYDKEKDNYIHFSCFDIKTSIRLEDYFLLKEIVYEGFLKFSYDVETNAVYVSSVPYIQYGNIQIPIFTSDIAQIIVKKLKKYGASNDIKLAFSNPFVILAQDERVIHEIPSVSYTKNHIFLAQVLEMIEKEKNKIIEDTIRHNQQQAKLERSREKAITNKRKLLGLDPKEFVSEEDFQVKLANKLINLWKKKIENIKRHLMANEKKYMKKMLGEDPYFKLKEHKYDFEFLLRTYLLQLLEEIGVKDVDKWLNLYGDEFTKEEYVVLITTIKEINLNSKINDVVKVWSYFYNFNGNLEKIIPNMVDEAICFLLEADLYSKNGVVSTFYNLTDSDIRKSRLPMFKLRELYQKERNSLTGFEIYEMFLRDDFEDEKVGDGYKNAKHHPAFKDTYLKYKEQRKIHQGDYFKVCSHMKKNNMRAYALDLIVQIARLREQLVYYEYLLNNPKKATLNFYKESKCWGSLMQIPYWRRLSCDPTCFADNYNLFMIKPGVQDIDIDYDDVVSFIDDYNFHKGKFKNKVLKSHLLGKTWKHKAARHSMIMIPDSLNNEKTNDLVRFAFIGGSSEIYFICESFEKERIIKQAILDEALVCFTDNERPISSCYVIVDPTYYDSFMKDTPNNKKLWKRYDYNSNYSYRIKEPIGFDIKISLAIPYAISGFDCIGLHLDYWILDELLFGGYTSKTAFPDIMDNYLKNISEESKKSSMSLTLKK